MRVSWDVVTESPIRLYGIALSHPVLGVQGMLERKALAYRYVELLGGAHPLALFALWFARPTVPAMRLSDGRRVQRDLAELPGLLDKVDGLIESGVIGGEELGAADFQIGASVRVLIAMQDVGRLVAGRPAEAFALRVVPDYPEVPAAMPADWLTPGSA
jgi:glutathione S-transferase